MRDAELIEAGELESGSQYSFAEGRTGSATLPTGANPQIPSLKYKIEEGQDGGFVVVDQDGWCVSEFDHVDYLDAEAELEAFIKAEEAA